MDDDGRSGLQPTGTPEMTRLFVYGTLKRGFCRQSYLAHEQFVSTAWTLPNYQLLDCGSYPALIGNGQNEIVGELYDVSEKTMLILDGVEGVDEGLYARGDVELSDGSIAVAYFYTFPTEGLPDIGSEWTRK